MARRNCLMILFSVILGDYVIIFSQLGGYLIIFGAVVFIFGAFFIIFGSNTIIFGAYFVIFGGFFIIFCVFFVMIVASLPKAREWKIIRKGGMRESRNAGKPASGSQKRKIKFVKTT